jgi:hypothetical protein
VLGAKIAAFNGLGDPLQDQDRGRYQYLDSGDIYEAGKNELSGAGAFRTLEENHFFDIISAMWRVDSA